LWQVRALNSRVGNTEPTSTESRCDRDSSFDCLAVLPAGLEQAGATELLALGATDPRPLRRAVRCHVDLGTYYRLHLQARTPFRLLRELASFPCRNSTELQAGVLGAADWDFWLPPERSFRVDASGAIRGLSHSHYNALAVKNALVDRQRDHGGRRSSVNLDDPDLSLHLHLSAGRPGETPRATLSLNGSGISLHRRGYRPAMGQAPLKENLAAGLMALSGWDGSVPLVDPLCGSGTLLIEAVSGVLGRAPGLIAAGTRHFALEKWPDFNPDLWQRELEVARTLRRSTLADGRPLAPVIGSDLDPKVISQARANASAAGLDGFVEWRVGDLRDLQPPATPGMLVTNPPYGARLGAREELPGLYADLSRMLKQRCRGWQLWLLSGDPALSEALHLKASRRIPISNGGIDCRWLHYEIR
jgi:putative N6-adenine-specific DNA methylase